MSFLEKLHDIDTFIFDVDGVLTNGSVYVQEDGTLLRRMHVRDGFAVRHAIAQGFRVVCITGGSSKGSKARMENLGVSEYFDNVRDKQAVILQLVEYGGLNLSSALYMGDDLPDYQAMRMVHLPTCPNDAVPEIRHIAQYISPRCGGDGCVRDVIEKTLRVQDKWVISDE